MIYTYAAYYLMHMSRGTHARIYKSSSSVEGSSWLEDVLKDSRV